MWTFPFPCLPLGFLRSLWLNPFFSALSAGGRPQGLLLNFNSSPLLAYDFLEPPGLCQKG
jgi:hypothetical protein